MILSALLPIRQFLGSVPKEIWYAIALALALLFYGNWQYGRGEDAEKAKWVAEVAQIRAERDKAMIAATAADSEIAALRGQEIEERRKELDDATANIPDQELTARQRARVCAERLRQGRRCEAPSTATAEGS